MSVALLAIGLQLEAAEPKSAVDCAVPKAGGAAAWSAHVCDAAPLDVAAAFWIRFDAADAVARLGFCDCYLAGDGTLRVRFHATETELLADETVTSKVRVKTGEWRHVELSYSMNSRRYALYVDGKFAAENDKLLLPRIRFTAMDLAGFRGAVRDFRYYDAALDSEELAIADATASECDALAARLGDEVARAKNPHLKAWAEEVKARVLRAGGQQADDSKGGAGQQADDSKGGAAAVGKGMTIAAWKRMKADAAKIATLNAALLASPAGTVSDQVVTAYEIPATTQDLYLPYVLPTSGTLTNRIETLIARDEYETVSLLVVPFKPVKSFTIRMGNLRSGANTINASDIDLKLVKRWYRTGGAWASYHVDLRMRVLTPDLVINDDKLVRVDEWKRSNEILMRYPGGTRYENVSDFTWDREWMHETTAWFSDAPTLQPLEFAEAGRNQQYLVTFHAKKETPPGLYTGTLDLVADGRNAGRIEVALKVLPFVLPQPKTYDDVTRDYFSHVNYYDHTDLGLANGLAFNMRNFNNCARNRRGVDRCLRLGYPLTDIFYDVPRQKYPKGDVKDLTDEELRCQDIAFVRPQQRYERMIETMTSNANFRVWSCVTSECGDYGSISLGPDRRANAYHEHTRLKLFSHGMTSALPTFSPGIYDMDSSVAKERSVSDVWHSIGGRSITYAAPFPGPENPAIMRRTMGLELYKSRRYDGQMLHGYIGDNLNEFGKYPGGDGDYRTFDMAFRQRVGCINRLALYGYREGFDDVRYATFLKTQALAHRDDRDQMVAREAKRQLHWLESVDGDNHDMDAFRSECAYRILTMRKLLAVRTGKED